MSLSGPQRIVLGSFPPSFRARYGDELMALASECNRGWPDTFDLARASARAWIHPRFCGSSRDRRRGRLQATTATVFAVWSLSTLAVAVFARGVDDQPVPGLRSWGWTAYVVGSAIFQLTVAAALVVGLGYWLSVVVPAWRRRDRRTILAAALPAGLVTIWLGGTGLVSLYARHQSRLPHAPQAWRLPGAGPGVVLVLYGAFIGVCVVGCAVAATRALARARLGDCLLIASALLSGAAAVALVAVTISAALCLSRVLLIGGIGPRDMAMAVTPTVFLAVASVLGVTSSLRALPLMLAPTSSDGIEARRGSNQE
jgi:MFS family permease